MVGRSLEIPPRPGLVANMIKTEIVQDHGAPIVLLQLNIDVPGNIIVYLGVILTKLPSQHAM
jgi:hypothetical protein